MKLKRPQLPKSLFLFLLFSFCVAGSAFSQVVSNAGKEFYVAFGKNDTVTTVKDFRVGDYTSVELTLRVAALATTDVTLDFTEQPDLKKTFRVYAGRTYDYILNTMEARASYSGNTTYNPNNNPYNYPGIKKTIHVTSTQPITLVAVNTAARSAEATQVWPVETWGKEYYNIGLPPYNYEHYDCLGFMIIAKEDNTVINNTFMGQFPGFNPMTLNKGEVYLYANTSTSYSNTNGAYVSGNKPFAFFVSGTRSLYDANGRAPQWRRRNPAFEQFPSVDTWGTEFILPTNQYEAGFVRIFPSVGNTTVTVRYTDTPISETFTLPSSTYYPGGYRDIIIDDVTHHGSKGCYISSDKPIGMAIFNVPSYHQMFGNRGDLGEPGEAWLPPVQQRVRNVLVSPLQLSASNVFMSMDHYMSIIVPTASKLKTTISLNREAAQPIGNATGFIWLADNIGGSGYSFGRFSFGEY